MTQPEVQALIRHLSFPAELVETHISWVILGPDLVYKIRKPIRYPFLDFSTLAKRQSDCERELILNKRHSPEVYLDVVAIRHSSNHWELGSGDGAIVDYAVKMKRLDNARQLDVLLKEGKVTSGDMEALARTLATFHQSAEIIIDGPTSHELWLDFADLLKVEHVIREELGGQAAMELIASADHARGIIHGLHARVRERLSLGYTRDVHGDLHARNIFLLEQPVMFDCLEFNDHLRQIDLLSEIAFLGMDLHAFGREDLWNDFLNHYQEVLPVLHIREDRELLEWYRWYRANVRLKVAALRAMQQHTGPIDPIKATWEEYLFFAKKNGFVVKMNML